MSDNPIEILPLTRYVGAEIRGVDVSVKLDSSICEKISKVLYQYGVVFFRNQNISDEQFLAFAEEFGEPRVNPLTHHVDKIPSIAKIVKEPWHETSTGDMWHADHTFLASPMNTMLRAVEVPAVGGDTLWVNTQIAFEHLPQKLKEELSRMNALHSHSFLIKDRDYAKKYEEEHGTSALREKKSSTTKMQYHPVIRQHPQTGKDVLFVNPGYTVKFEGWSREKSEPLLSTLYDHCLKPEFQCRFKWDKGSIAMWDNSQTWHFAVNDYSGFRREMHRIVIG